ncbi:MAG: hypothetical protein WCG66_11755 [bacterium]
MDRPLNIRLAFFQILLVVFFAGCASQKFDAANAPEYEVQTDYAPFYTLGPGQERGPDLSLQRGDRVRVLRREFGFSFVSIRDGRSGYVANEEIAPAPQSVQVASRSRKHSPRKHSPRTAPRDPSFSGNGSSSMDVEAFPEPVDVLNPVSEIETTAGSKPEFRY